MRHRGRAAGVACFCALVFAASVLQSGKAVAAEPVTATVRDIDGRVLDLKGRILDLHANVLSMEVKETPKIVTIELPADILFDFDKYDIRSSAVPALEQAADVLRRRAHGPVEVDGHTDSIGTNDYNRRLSERRAESVRRWLVDRASLTKLRFHTKGFAATRPVAPNTNPDGSDNPEGRQKNRRVEIVFAK